MVHEENRKASSFAQFLTTVLSTLPAPELPMRLAEVLVVATFSAQSYFFYPLTGGNAKVFPYKLRACKPQSSKSLLSRDLTSNIILSLFKIKELWDLPRKINSSVYT